MFLCSKLVTVLLLCCVNAGNVDFILLPQLQERLKKGRIKSYWVPSRELATWGTAWPFPCIPPPSLSIFWSWSLFVQVTAGTQHIITQFPLPFLELTTLFLASVDSLGPSASYISRTVPAHFGTPQIQLPFALFETAPQLFCVSHFCSLSLSGLLPSLILLHRILLLVLIAGFSPTLWGCCLFPFCFPSL